MRAEKLVTALPTDAAAWSELRSVLTECGYTTAAVRSMLGLSASVEAILGNVGRFSLQYLWDLEEIDEPAAILARLFLFSGMVSEAELNRLPKHLLTLLRRLRLVEPVAVDQRLARGTVSISEYNRMYFLSDKLFENSTDGYTIKFTLNMHDGLCMPPHTSSFELQRKLRSPATTRSFLDVGCGSGFLSILAACDYERIAGIDPSDRAVMFSTVNSLVNDVPARYGVDTWETFQTGKRYDHIVFNAPHTDVGFGFVNGKIEDLLTDSGLGQIWVSCEVTKEDGDLNGFIERMCASQSALQVTGTANVDSPFSLSADHIHAGTLPPDTLLVSRPAEQRPYLHDLANRNVIEVVSAILWVRRR